MARHNPMHDVLRFVGERASDAVLQFDATGVCIAAHESSLPVLGVEADAAIGETCNTLLGVSIDLIADSARHERPIVVSIPGGTREPTMAWAMLIDRAASSDALVLVSRTPAESTVSPSVRSLSRPELLGVIDRLTRQNETLERMAGVLAHDLAAPIRRISSFGQLIERAPADAATDELRGFIGHIVDASHLASRLITALREYSQIGDLPLAHGSVDLDDVLARALGVLSERVEADAAKVQVDELPTVRSSVEAMSKIFTELLRNALDHRHPDRTPEISVSARRDYDVIRIEVTDNGIGVDRSLTEQIFDPFRRLHTDHEHHTGLGLATARRLAERVGGRLWCEPRSDGTTFVLRVPADGQPLG